MRKYDKALKAKGNATVFSENTQDKRRRGKLNDSPRFKTHQRTRAPNETKRVTHEAQW